MDHKLSHLFEFTKLSAMHACVPTWSTSKRAWVPVWCMCQRACVPTCQRRANFSSLHANVPTNVPTCQTACQIFKLAANLPKVVAIFQEFLIPNAKGNKKFYITIDIKVIHIMCICICNARENCVILRFYASCHIKGKCAKFFFFSFFLFCIYLEMKL